MHTDSLQFEDRETDRTKGKLHDVEGLFVVRRDSVD